MPKGRERLKGMRPSFDPLAECKRHEMQNCSIRWPLDRGYRRGRVPLGLPTGYYVERRGGRGIYHHPDCYNVTCDCQGGDAASLGERIVRSPHDIEAMDLRPAQCCEPPNVP